MIEYRVRSVSLLNLVNDLESGRLIPDAYFQRNLVWRDIHKRDFIKTILLGYPFPQIFISKGRVNVEKMTTVSCIVDGQQRSNAIIGFIKGEFDVDDKKFVGLTESEKADFLKYEIAVIELDLENDDPKVQEIFQRINRTSNSLTSIEKLASQYATSEYMLVAKLLSDQITPERSDEEDFREDPNIPNEFYVWAEKQPVKHFIKLLNEKGVFNPRELARKTNLMHTLNIMSTIIGGFFNRNEKTIDNLDNYATSFDNKEQLIKTLNNAAEFILKMGLKHKSYWLNKANLFSLIIAVANIQKNGHTLNPHITKEALDNFFKAIPEDYKLAAAEAVNSTKARQIRDRYITEILNRTH